MLSVLIKPASSDCQLNCDYCFYRNEAENRKTYSCGKMSEETLEKIVSEVFLTEKNAVSFLFQGGEPLLAGKSFFEKAVAFQKKYNTNRIPVYNSVQTNGILLDEEWCGFFYKNGFLAGISLDGTSAIQQKHRVFPSGKNSFDQALTGAKLLQKHRVDFSVLSVVTNETLAETENIYRFFRKNGFFNIQFIPCIEPIGLSGTKFLSPENYGEFLIKIFDLWYNDLKNGIYVSIRHIENYIRILLGISPEECGMTGKCTLQITAEADGSVYPCDFYSTDGFLLGQVGKDPLKSMINGSAALAFLNGCETFDGCKTCEFYGLCKNGCRRYRVGEKNIFCDSYRRFFTERKNVLISAAGIMKRFLPQ